MSKWESRQAFLASGITLRPPGEIAEGETRPRERFLLEEAGTAEPYRHPLPEQRLTDHPTGPREPVAGEAANRLP